MIAVSVSLVVVIPGATMIARLLASGAFQDLS